MVPGVFSQVYIHLVFSPKLFCPVQSVHLQDHLFKYISGVVNKMRHNILLILKKAVCLHKIFYAATHSNF